MEQEQQLLTEPEAAEDLDLQPPSLRRYRTAGKGPAYIKKFGRVFYTRQALQDYKRHRVLIRRGKRSKPNTNGVIENGPAN